MVTTKTEYDEEFDESTQTYILYATEIRTETQTYDTDLKHDETYVEENDSVMGQSTAYFTLQQVQEDTANQLNTLSEEEYSELYQTLFIKMELQYRDEPYNLQDENDIRITDSTFSYCIEYDGTEFVLTFEQQ